ncbi:hypothetical protein E1287_27265 [Actinomadura sp. KC06]|uniref:hypothetical protein n=1 Tax=Actinomadura sp. KC06 TaxID=2530369 RepID=UPI00104D2E8E|nr:hypothetical protein [Actinomadura sp. KC06]TDD31218.1 hypothetical protein E1287_27265 [Actinomadura sp. KC06]
MVAHQSQSPASRPSEEASPPDRQDERHRVFAEVGPLLGLINGVIAAFVGAYATTGSLLVTVIAGGAALTLAALALIKK